MSDTEQRTIDITADLIRNMARQNEPFINIAMAIDAHYRSLQPTPQPQAKAVDGELRELARKFGNEFEWPYRFMPDMDRSPADQQQDAQEKLLDEFLEAFSAHLQTAVQAERNRWQKASMERLAKYDETGVPPETQALIDAAVREARINELGRAKPYMLQSPHPGDYFTDRLHCLQQSGEEKQ